VTRLFLHDQVSSILQRKILAGELPPHERLPSEAALCRTFGVSRVTIRVALKELSAGGFVYSRQGKGTFVSAPQVTYDTNALLGFHEAMQGKPFRASFIVRSVRTVRASREVADALKVKRASAVLEVNRLRCLGGRPVSVNFSFFPPDVGARLHDQDLAQDIFPLLERLKVPLGRSSVCIEARDCPSQFAQDLGLQVGQAVLYVRRVTCSTLGRPVDYGSLYCRADSYQYKVELTRWP
jgi:GntR family transcriptional regulator